MTFAWVRSIGLSNTYEVGQTLLGRLNLGQTYIRVHFRWGVYGDTTDRIDMQAVASNLITFGLVSPDAGVITWRDTGSTEPTDTKGQVLFTGFAPGPTLNLWATWAAPFAWDPSGIAAVWFGASVLYKTP